MDDSDQKRDRVLKAALDYRVELLAYARSLLGNYAAAEDAVQDAMLVVVKKFDQFQEGTSVLAGRHAMSDAHDWQELIDRHLRGELSGSEQEGLAELLDSDAAARKDFVEQAQWDTRLAEVLRECRGSSREPNVDEGTDASFVERTVTIGKRTPATRITSLLLAAAAVIIVALIASLYSQQANTRRPDRITVQQPSVDLPIAKISGLSGPLQWTGDGGRVTYDLVAGAELSGGTIEGLAPGSWFELEFNDGSTATISGNSMLTFSDHGQKVLHLKQGNLSSNVKPQPTGEPMLVYTRSAVLEVLGTQFEVELIPPTRGELE